MRALTIITTTVFSLIALVDIFTGHFIQARMFGVIALFASVAYRRRL